LARVAIRENAVSKYPRALKGLNTKLLEDYLPKNFDTKHYISITNLKSTQTSIQPESNTIMVKPFYEPQLSSAQQKREEARRRKEREDEDRAAAQRLAEEKAQLERQEREAAKKARATERREAEDQSKAEERAREEARAKAAEAKRIFEEARAKAVAEVQAKRAAEAAKAAAATDKPDGSINDHLQGLNAVGKDGDEVMEDADKLRVPYKGAENESDDEGAKKPAAKEVIEIDEGAGDAVGRSPQKKKSRSEEEVQARKERKAEKKAAKKAAKEKATHDRVEQPTPKAAGRPVSILKQKSTAFKLTTARKNHVHKHRRQIVDTSIVLDAPGGRQARMNQFTKALQSLVENCILMDSTFQIEPRNLDSDKPPLYHQDEISANHTVMSFHIRTSGGSESFDLQKPRKKDKQKGGRRRNQAYEDEEEEEPDLVNPQVYLNFACSMDMDPQELFDCVGVEWGRLGGAKVYLKAFNSFDTGTCAMVLCSWNRLSADTFLDEFEAMFNEGKELMNDQMFMEGNTYEDYDLPYPKIALRLKNPVLNGEDKTAYSGWPTSKQFKRKCIHLEAERKDFAHIHSVVDVMKNAGVVEKYWGRNAHLSNILHDKNGKVTLLPGELVALSAMAREHVNFQGSMTSNVLSGIDNLNKSFEYRSAADPERVEGEITLRHLLYKYVFMSDGHSLFVELHHRSSISDVEVIIPNTREAKEMLEEMNKNSAAWLYFYLQEHNIPADFLITVLKGSMDPLLCQQINKCKWVTETKKLILPKDKEAAAAKELSKAAWYKDEFGGVGKQKQEEEFADEEFMYDQDADKSVKTIHEKKGGGTVYKGSPNAPTFSVGRPNEIPAGEETGDDVSEISALSRDDLVKLCKSLQLKAKNPTKGSPPETNVQKASDKSPRDDKDSKSVHSVGSSSSSSSGSSSSDESSGSCTTKAAGGASTTNHGGSEGASQASPGE
jgi:hypothetical protein